MLRPEDDQQPTRHQWRVKRGSEAILFPSDYQPDPSSWFERNKLSVLQSLLTGSDDIRQSRLHGMRLLSDACKPAFFKRHPEAKEQDRQLLVRWLQQWLTVTGFATRKEVAWLEMSSILGQESHMLRYYEDLANVQGANIDMRQDVQPLPYRWPPGELRIALFGSFGPLTPTHTSFFAFYRMFCHMFVVGLDSDELLSKRKPEVARRYPYRVRRSIISGFPHLVDAVLSLPADFKKGHDYDDAFISDFIRRSNINVVAINPAEPGADRRRAQIWAAGATPFDMDAGATPMLRSRHIRELKDKGLLGFKSLT